MRIEECLKLEHAEGRGLAVEDQSLIVYFEATENAQPFEELEAVWRASAAIVPESAKLHFSAWNALPQLISDTLALGWSVKLSSRLQTRFVPDDVFSWRDWELKDVHELYSRHAAAEQDIENRKTPNWDGWQELCATQRETMRYMWHYWNWFTPEGKRLCTQLREAIGKRNLTSQSSQLPPRFALPGFDERCREERVLHRGTWSACEPTYTLLDEYVLESAEKQLHSLGHLESAAKRQRESEEDLCLVCKERPPQTLVLPCGHVVVCMECSLVLQTDRLNAHRCILCRTEITEILTPG